MDSADVNQPKRGRGRPPKVSPLDEIPVCLVKPRATLKQRKAAFLEATSKRWTMRQACGAAGVSRKQGEEWLADSQFAEEYESAQASFLDACEEILIQQATGRAGRIARASTQALQSFLTTHSAPYYRSRAEALLRQAGAMQEMVLRILRRNVPQAIVDQVEAELDRLREAIEGSAGARVKP